MNYNLLLFLRLFLLLLLKLYLLLLLLLLLLLFDVFDVISRVLPQPQVSECRYCPLPSP